MSIHFCKIISFPVSARLAKLTLRTNKRIMIHERNNLDSETQIPSTYLIRKLTIINTKDYANLLIIILKYILNRYTH